jgi:hypothetical protein
MNGVFKFTIDDVDQNIGSDYFQSGMWSQTIIDIPPGPHRL